MSMISPSSRLPFRTIVVLGAAITALCAGGAGVTARATKRGRVPRARLLDGESSRHSRSRHQRAGERTLRQSASQL